MVRLQAKVHIPNSNDSSSITNARVLLYTHLPYNDAAQQHEVCALQNGGRAEAKAMRLPLRMINRHSPFRLSTAAGCVSYTNQCGGLAAAEIQTQRNPNTLFCCVCLCNLKRMIQFYARSLIHLVNYFVRQKHNNYEQLSVFVVDAVAQFLLFWYAVIFFSRR